MKDLLDNNIALGIIALTIISCWALCVMGISAKDVVIPAIAGISGLVTGIAIKSAGGSRQN